MLAATYISNRFKKYLPITHRLSLNIYDLISWVVIPGIIGARIYHILDFWNYYLADPKKIFYFWEGGLGIYGGIIGGIIGLWIFVKLKCKTAYFIPTFLLYLDLIAIGLPIGQAIGRLGNYINQELYGLPTNLPWGIYIRPENRLIGWENFTKFHPLFLYESLWCVLIFLILFLFITHQLASKRPGNVFFIYLFLYAFGRFWLEYLRIDSWVMGGWRINQLVSVSCIGISFIYWVNSRLHS